MTREEIKQLKCAEPNCFETSREEEWYCEGLVQGLEITEKELIDKACWWLRETAHFYVSDFTGELDDNGLVEDFKKAMKGE